MITLLLLLTLPAFASETLEATAELETASNPAVTGSDQTLTLDGAWRVAPEWQLGAELEAKMPASATGESAGLGDSRVTFARAFGDSIAFGPLVMLPSDRGERAHGMTAAPGAILTVEAEPLPLLKASLESTLARFVRSAAEDLAGSDRWRVENELTFGYPVWRAVSVEASGTHAYSWKWEGARESTLTLEQKVAYAIGAWELAVGHRNETKLLAADGTALAPALHRSGESSMFGTLTWAL
jgi:hypothetical protein